MGGTVKIIPLADADLGSLSKRDSSRFSSYARRNERRLVDSIRVMQWNVLAEGLGNDGFLVRSDGPDATHAIRQEQDVRVKTVLTQIKEACDGKDDERESKLQAVKDAFKTESEQQLFDSVCAWEHRWPRMKHIIKESDADILVMMEVDHMADMQACCSAPHQHADANCSRPSHASLLTHPSC